MKNSTYKCRHGLLVEGCAICYPGEPTEKPTVLPLPEEKRVGSGSIGQIVSKLRANLGKAKKVG